MAEVEVYSSDFCPFCIRAKRLLKHKSIDFIEYKVDGNRDLRAEMEQRADGRYTVPQIFIDQLGIGGCDDLFALEKRGKLDQLLVKG